MGGGFKCVLELPDGDVADPAMFNTALPPGMWKPGDNILAAYDLRQSDDAADDCHAASKHRSTYAAT